MQPERDADDGVRSGMHLPCPSVARLFRAAVVGGRIILRTFRSVRCRIACGLAHPEIVRHLVQKPVDRKMCCKDFVLIIDSRCELQRHLPHATMHVDPLQRADIHEACLSGKGSGYGSLRYRGQCQHRKQ